MTAWQDETTIIRKEAIVGLKLILQHCLLGSCVLLLLAPACATSSKSGKRTSASAKKKALPARAATAGSASDGKSKPNPPASAKAPAESASAGTGKPSPPASAKAPAEPAGAGTGKPSPPASAKAAKPAAVVQAKKPPAPPPEPEMPAHLPQPLYCPAPSEVPPDTELTMRCAARPALGTPKVVFNYRPSGTDHFIAADATRSPKGWYVIKIRGADVKGSALQFFAQAYNANNRVTASNGTDESPNILLIRKGATDQLGLDDDPLAHVQREKDAAMAALNEGPRRPTNRVWLGMGMGTGYGWFPAGSPETYGSRGSRVPSSLSFGGVLHLLPEVGYQWTDHIMFSLQGRYQFVHTAVGSGCVSRLVCPPSNDTAWAVLGRVYLLSDRLFGRASHLQVFGTGSLGAGSAFRLYVAPSHNFLSSDTMRGGPFVAGLGGGVVYHFTDYLALAAELRALAGFWNVATVFEGGLSAQWAFWSPGARAPTAAPAFDTPPESDDPSIE